MNYMPLPIGFARRCRANSPHSDHVCFALARKVTNRVRRVAGGYSLSSEGEGTAGGRAASVGTSSTPPRAGGGGILDRAVTMARASAARDTPEIWLLPCHQQSQPGVQLCGFVGHRRGFDPTLAI